MLKVKSQLVEVHGVKSTVKAMFELVSWRCSILSIGRPVGKEVVVVMEMNVDTSHTGRTERYPFTSAMVCITSGGSK